MDELKKLNGTYRYTQYLTLTAVGIMGIVMIISTLMAFFYAKEFSKRIYILNKNEHFQALAGDVAQNRPVEIQYHVQRFHELFFGLSPDPKQIENNMQKAAYLGDESILRLYNDLKEQDFYNNLIQGNVVQNIQIDSVQVNTANYPYSAVCYFRLSQNRATANSEQFIVSYCKLVDIPRSINSPNGLFLRNFKIVNSKKKYVLEESEIQ
ncbi:MAG: conjugative transposon protein TraK [Bacteroidota bacterium]